MSLFLPLTLFALIFCQGLEISQNNQSVTVVSYKWTSFHETTKQPDAPSTSPPPEITLGNKSAGRTARINNPLIPDPQETTIDGRSAAIEKAVQEARTAKPTSRDRYQYVMRIHNGSTKPIDVVFWEYQFISSGPNGSTTRRQFLCGVKIKRDKDADIQAFGLLGPGGVVVAATPEKSVEERAVINRIEFSDGTIWQRRDWNFAEIRDSVHRALDHPWEGEMCRAL
jgi:hypothetical protein